MVLIGWLFIFLMMCSLWVLQKRTGDSGIVDVAWGTGVGLLGLFYAIAFDGGQSFRKVMVVIVAAVWAARLSLFVFSRTHKLPEDGRYQALKEKWGAQAQWRMFRFYQMQGIGCVLFSIPMLLAVMNPSDVGWLDYLGLGVGVLAILGEAISDWQLNRFRVDPGNQGEVYRDGLWSLSRHPNYFFEWLHWWAYVCFSATYLLGWLTVVGPIAMFFFITRVTGIPLTEEQAIKSRGDKYREYQKTTNAFFPWFPEQAPEIWTRGEG